MQIGDKLVFGEYEWRVLDIKNSSALIITDYIVELRAYHDAYTDITWADCALRKYLNGEFFDKFNEFEQSRIIPVRNKNLDNQWYGTKGGEDTDDRIFLLSIEEAACKYFGDSSEHLSSPSNRKHKYWFDKKDKNNELRIARLEFEKEWSWWWWLRSPGRLGVKAVYMHGDGNIGIQGNNILKCNIGGPFYNGDNRGGVRPAMWLAIVKPLENR